MLSNKKKVLQCNDPTADDYFFSRGPTPERPVVSIENKDSKQ